MLLPFCMEEYMNEYDKKQMMEEECRIAKSVDLVYLAKQFGFTPFKSGKLHRMKEDESLVIYDSNTFCHFYHRGTPGYAGSPIDFVMTYGNMSMRDAIKFLLDEANYDREKNVYMPEQKYAAKKKQAKELKVELPIPNDNYRRVFAYLANSRGIASDIISKFMHEKRLYESKNKHNCVFVTYDADGTPKYAALRGTLTIGSGSSFRGDVEGSDKDLGFPYYQDNSDTVLVFEAPIDMMSFMTLYPENNDSYVALGCLALNALDTFLEAHKNIKNIGFILDNDSNAPQVVSSAKLEYASKGYNIIEHELTSKLKLENVKDVNEYLVKTKGVRKNSKAKKL